MVAGAGTGDGDGDGEVNEECLAAAQGKKGERERCGD